MTPILNPAELPGAFGDFRMPERSIPRRTHVAAGLVAAVLGGTTALLALLGSTWLLILPIAGIGSPIAAVLGYRGAQAARYGRDVQGAGIRLGFLAYVFGVLAGVFVTEVSHLVYLQGIYGGSLAEQIGDTVVGGALGVLFGLILVSPILLLTIPLGIAWAFVVRHLPDRWFGPR